MSHPPLRDIEAEAAAWLTRLTSGEATQADADAVTQWRRRSSAHEQAFRDAARLWQASGAALEPRAAEGGPARQGVVVTRRLLLGGALAASAAGVAVLGAHHDLWPSLEELLSDHRTGRGEQRAVVLPDGSKASLNTRTALSLDFSARSRRVKLIDGEVIVSIAGGQDRALSVAAGDGAATARSGAFAVRNLGGEVSVTCIEGVVTISCGESVDLRANEQVAYSDGRLGAVAKVDAALATAWTRGMLVFRDESVARVVAELNRYRPGRIVLMRADATSQRVSGVFHLDRLDEALDHVETVLGLGATRLAGGLVLLY